jgi:hypothetical protein
MSEQIQKQKELRIAISKAQYKLALDAYTKQEDAQKRVGLVLGMLLAQEFEGNGSLHSLGETPEGEHFITFIVPDNAPETSEGQPANQDASPEADSGK